MISEKTRVVEHGSDSGVLPVDYAERIYAGVLGKLIGVYLGRPFEGWTYDRIMSELGEIWDYVHDRFDMPLVVTDDDITGTFTFLRALEDNGYDVALTSAQVGDAWLNYLIENRTILWWGGLGTSTEHTAYMRLKHGIAAPASGSSAMNGKTIAEQIGAQIFIDAWAMLYPGDPARAVDIAGRAARVSHDGEAVYGAQIIAAMEAMAFVERDLNVLLDTAVSFIPPDSTIARLIADIRHWHAGNADWRDTLVAIQHTYGYDRYRGNCHMVPNHALIIHALLHGEDDFQRSLMIANTSGWDTDCNSGNVGAILGIKNGLAAIDTSPVDWRGPIADRMYLSTADGGRAITDAVIESIRIVNAGRALHGETLVAPKEGARFHFSLPGSVQGFRADENAGLTISHTNGKLQLLQSVEGLGIATTPVFILPETGRMRGYTLYASPTLHPGQTVQASVSAPRENKEPVSIRPLIRVYAADNAIETRMGEKHELTPGQSTEIAWTIPDLGRMPIMSFGFRIEGPVQSAVLVDRVDWNGAPTVELGRPLVKQTMWRRAWVDGVDQWEARWLEDYHIVQNSGTGLISQGTEDWKNYTAMVKIVLPLAKSGGIAARVGGMRRYLALVLEDDGFARLVKMQNTRKVLAEAPFVADPDTAYTLELRVQGTAIEGRIDNSLVLEATDTSSPLPGGGVGLVVTEGTLSAGVVTILGR